jgi:hypothetical protein
MAPSETYVMSARHREVELLLRCARSRKSLGTLSDIDTLLRADTDWEYVLRMAVRHGVAPLVYWHLSDNSLESVPEHILGHLQDRFHANRLRNLLLAAELLKLLDKMEACGISAIPYKGPVLASSAYGDLALREFGDLDVLIRKKDVLRAREILTSLGYEPQHRMTNTQEAALLQYDRQYPFARGDGNVVELHWTPTPRSVSFFLDPEHLWGQTRLVRLGGGTVSTFGPEDTILVLCVHGSSHLWERLGWICDVAELVQASEDLDWEWLVERAEAYKVKRMLLLGLFLASDLLDVVLPEKILREVRADQVVRKLAAQVRGDLFSEDRPSYKTFGRMTRWRFHLGMIERSRDKLRYCIHRSTTPTQDDWELLPLPVALFPCYRLLRAIRLSGAAGRRLAERLQ